MPMLITALAAGAFYFSAPQKAESATTEPGPGSLIIVGKEGAPPTYCPLKHTDVVADIAGLGAAVTVKQSFTNPSSKAIEALYTFPLPAEAAVYRMTMKVGDRLVVAQIKKREEARATYEAAKRAGQTASLLDQERDNVFTQSVANIMPGAKVDVEISFIENLPFRNGEYQFLYPMVVGPRYLANAPDPNKINPPFVKSTMRSGSNISLKVNLDAGAAIKDLRSELHEVEIHRPDSQRAVVSLRSEKEIPNKDFILHYSLAQDGVQETFRAYKMVGQPGFFNLVLNPPRTLSTKEIAQREYIFVIDQSGSQSGFPIAKSRDLTKRLIHRLGPNDTFTVLGFSNNVDYLWEEPKPATTQNLAEADRFISHLDANGGTELFTAVNAALDIPKTTSRFRIIAFNTDGYVGDEARILGAIEARSNEARFFTFGIGNSVNHFLIDSMSSFGRGDSETVTLPADADAAVNRFVARTESPVLTNVSVSFDGGDVTDVTPSRLPDVFSQKPLVISGRYTKAGPARAIVRGTLGGVPWTRAVDINLPEEQVSGPSVATLWARSRISDLNADRWRASYEAKPVEGYVGQITQLGLDYSLMTEFTSLVAVEERIVNVGGEQVSIEVPVDLPDGVSEQAVSSPSPANRSLAKSLSSGGFGGGRGAALPTASAPMTLSRPGSGSYARDEAATPILSTDVQFLRAFLNSPKEDTAIAYRLMARDQLTTAIESLSKAEKARFWFLVKASAKLWKIQVPTMVQILLKSKEAKNLQAELRGVSMEHPSYQGLSLVIAKVDSETLKGLTSRVDVVEVVPAKSR